MVDAALARPGGRTARVRSAVLDATVAELIEHAVETFAAAQAEVPDSGDIDQDLRMWARSILATLTGPVSGALVRAVFGGAGDSPQVRDLRHRFWLTRSTLVMPVIQHAVERGRLP